MNFKKIISLGTFSFTPSREDPRSFLENTFFSPSIGSTKKFFQIKVFSWRLLYIFSYYKNFFWSNPWVPNFQNLLVEKPKIKLFSFIMKNIKNDAKASDSLCMVDGESAPSTNFEFFGGSRSLWCKILV